MLTASPGNVQAIYLQAVLQVQAKDYRSADATLEKIGAFVAQIPRGYFLQAVIKEELGELHGRGSCAPLYRKRPG